MLNRRNPDYQAIAQYIQEKFPRVFKPAGGHFRHPFIDPGSIYDGNLWDWDTFWTTYALIAFSKDDAAPEGFAEKLIQHGKGNVLNFLDFQLEDGYIPMMVSHVNQPGGEEPYLIRKHKEGHILNMHKPFLCQQTALVSEYCGDYGWAAPHADQYLKYFECYDRYYFNEHCGLYVWADDVMIGMDNDPAVFGRPRFSTASTFLNGFMVGELKSAAKLMDKFARPTEAARFRCKAEELAETIRAECFDQRDRFFYSVDVDIKTRSYDWFHKGLGVFWKTLPIKIRAWTAFIPLFTGIATPAQAQEMVRHMTDTGTFACDYGVRTLSRDERMYNLEATNNPSNWLGPIWLVTNYVCFRGLINYGYTHEAETLCRQTLRLLGDDLRTSGDLHEYYVPETGHPVMSPGFLNWDMLALNMVQELEGTHNAFEGLYE